MPPLDYNSLIVYDCEMNHDIRLGDSFELLKTLPDNSVDFCLTDPPYFIDGLGDEWDPDEIEAKSNGDKSTVKSLPGGMRFDPQQGVRFEEFMTLISHEVYRVLKPGAFYVAFSQARLYHRLGIAVENAGFELRDMMGWTYQGQAKAFGMDHIIRKQKTMTEAEKAQLSKELQGWKTPQLKPMIEPMCLAQKPLDGKFIDNWQKWGVGLVNTNIRTEGFPGNLMPYPKPKKSEKGEYNTHVSVKPVALCEHLIGLFTQPNQTILDPFLGSGTTLVASELTGRNCVGFEISKKYYDIIKLRLADTQK